MTLRLDDVAAEYGGHVVFHDVRFSLEPGQLVGLIGPNGAGKTTLLRMIAGLIRPSRGCVIREGGIMYFGGESTLPPSCTARRWASLLGASTGSRRRIGRLSRGTRQLLGLGAWLARDDWSLGLLDEPWEGLDPDASRWLTRALERHRERGASLIVSSHRLHDVASVCSSYAFLGHGTFRWIEPDDPAGARVDAARLLEVFEQTGGS